MKVRDTRGKLIIPFDQIKVGECFMCEDYLYIKTENFTDDLYGDKYNAVYLCDGSFCQLSEDDVVEPVQVEAIIS